MLDILLIGATGFTGKQTAKYLNTHPAVGTFTWGIAGRSTKRLQALAADISLPETVQVVEVDTTKYEQVEAAVKQTKIVISTVGPYDTWGTPIIEACATHGVHYVDITGETWWISKMIKRFDYLATKTGAIIVPSCGFDSVPSDLSVHVGQKTLSDFDPSLDIESSITAFRIKAGVSGGTIASALNMFDIMAVEGKESLRAHFSLPPASRKPFRKPKLLYSLPIPGAFSIIGSFFFMKPSNQAIVQRSWGLLEVESKQNPSPELKKRYYGTKFLYDEFAVMPNRVVAAAVSCVFIFGQLCLTISPIRWLVKKVVPPPGSGPSDADLKSNWFKTTNLTTSAVSDAHPEAIHAKTTISGKGDAGYYLTPVMVAESALSILFDRDSLPILAQRGGLLTPATAFGDVLVDRLNATGLFEIESSIVSDKKTT